MTEEKSKNFLYFYLRSMRLYYGFVSGSATLTGIALTHAYLKTPWSWCDAIILTAGYLAQGVNQIFNDYANRTEDRINAPHRPMITGELPTKKAMMLSVSLMGILLTGALSVSPWTALPVIAGSLLNLLYGSAKKIPVLGCLVYGLSLLMYTLFGAFGAGLATAMPSNGAKTALTIFFPCSSLVFAHADVPL